MSTENHDYLLLQQLVEIYFKENRQKVNYTQDELENLSDISAQTISKIETGKNIPELKTFFHLVIALGMDANEIIADYKANSEYFNRD